MAVMAGNGVHRSAATKELIQLVETLSVALFTTPAGKGAVPEDHPLCLGVHGPFPGSPAGEQDPLQEFLDSIDTVLVVGTSLSLSKTKTRGLRLPPNLIHIDIDAESIGKVYETSLSVVGDAKGILGRRLKERLLDYKRQVMPNQMKTMEAIRSVAARDAVFMGDVNVAVHGGANYCLDAYEPRPI